MARTKGLLTRRAARLCLQISCTCLEISRKWDNGSMAPPVGVKVTFVVALMPSLHPVSFDMWRAWCLFIGDILPIHHSHVTRAEELLSWGHPSVLSDDQCLIIITCKRPIASAPELLIAVGIYQSQPNQTVRDLDTWPELNCYCIINDWNTSWIGTEWALHKHWTGTEQAPNGDWNTIGSQPELRDRGCGAGSDGNKIEL